MASVRFSPKPAVSAFDPLRTFREPVGFLDAGIERSRVDNRLKDETVERVLFILLLAALGVGGVLYERFRIEVPGWRLPAVIGAGYCLAYIAYRVALKRALRKRSH